MHAFSIYLCFELLSGAAGFKKTSRLHMAMANEEGGNRSMSPMILQDYLKRHSVRVLQGEGSHALCARSFALTVHWCHTSIGNGIGYLLNGLATAVVTDRTFVIHGHCNHYLSDVQDQFVTWDQLQGLWTQAGCAQHLQQETRSLPRWQEWQFRCCDFGPNSPRVINVGVVQPYASFLQQNANLDEASRQRAEELFRRGDADWFVWGELLRAALAWSPRSAGLRQRVMNKMNSYGSKNTVKVGIHVRHPFSARTSADVDKIEKMDARTIACLTSITAKFTGKEVILLVASDRAETISAINNTFAQHTIPQRRIVVTDKVGVDGTSSSEHGPYEGLDDMMSDLYMLSNSDVFLGSYGSTFSNLAAYGMAISPSTSTNIYRSDTCEPWVPVMGMPGDMERFKAEQRHYFGEIPSAWTACTRVMSNNTCFTRKVKWTPWVKGAPATMTPPNNNKERSRVPDAMDLVDDLVNQ